MQSSIIERQLGALLSHDERAGTADLHRIPDATHRKSGGAKSEKNSRPQTRPVEPDKKRTLGPLAYPTLRTYVSKRRSPAPSATIGATAPAAL